MIELLGSGWVRFIFPLSVESGVHVVGDFSEWDEQAHPMAHQDDGTHQVLLRLRPGEYQFKYKVGSVWFNDSHAHTYVQNVWGSENSVVIVPDDGQGGDLTTRGGQIASDPKDSPDKQAHGQQTFPEQ